MRRAAVLAALLILMAAFGLGVNRYFAGATRVGQINDAAVRPPTELPTNIDLPGTLYVAQRGTLYRLRDRHFTKLPEAPSGRWTQPAPVNDGTRLVAVLRGEEHSDLYLLDADGNVVRQLTRNAGRTVADNHWVFWPRTSPDGGRLFVSYDSPKHQEEYEVDLSVWSGTLDDRVTSHRWSTPNPYTGGDVHPAPLPSGGVVYSRYAIAEGRVFSTLVLQRTMSSEPVALTNPREDCDQATVSADGASIAMICSQGKQTTRLVTGQLRGTTVDDLRVLVPDCLCSGPAWAPDGSGIAYLAPADAAGHFQLWWVAGAPASPQQPQRVTTNLDLDATSAAAWMTGPSGQLPSAADHSPASTP